MQTQENLQAAKRVLARKATAYWRTVFPERYRIFEGCVLPPPGSADGGAEYGDDRFFLDSAIAEARRVLTKLASAPDDRLVDIGCGHGRLSIGLLHESSSLSYLGLDVQRDSIDWCQRYIQRRHPSYQFRHINVVNELSNPAGDPIAPDYQLPVQAGTADIVYMWGVFTNMEPAHLTVYAREFYRLLRPGGKAFLTAHVEDDVPRSSVNPENYTPYACHGPLHAVRYERGYFLDAFRQAGLILTELNYHAAGNCQSDVYFVKP